MPHALPLDDETYAMITAYAKAQHCSLTAALRKLLGGQNQPLMAGGGGPAPVTRGGSGLPVFSMGTFQPGIDPHKLGQLPDDF